MKSFTKIFSIVCVIIGAVIGAGFATGKEIHNFFCGYNPILVALSCFVFFTAVFSLVFLVSKKSSAKSIGELLSTVFGKFSVLPECFVVICYFLVMSTMLAASNDCIAEVIGYSPKIPVFSFITAFVALLALRKELKGIKTVNIVCIPLVIVFIVLLCLGKPTSTPTEFSILPCISYTCFNCLMAVGVLIPSSLSMSKKECVICAVISAAVISTLIGLVVHKLNDEVFYLVPMPLLSISKGYGKETEIIAVIVLYLSIFTSIVSCAYPVVAKIKPIVNNEKTAVVSVMTAAALFSTVGFSIIIDKIYPIMALLGVIVFVMLFVISLYNRLNRSSIKSLSQ